jgi:hypothetical protein
MLPVATADTVATPDRLERWSERHAARRDPVFRQVLREFLAHGGPVPLDAITASFADRPGSAVADALAALDADDILVIHEGRITLAYPFSAAPMGFAVVLGDGRPRETCCAVDALGIAAMLDERIHIRSSCHHCGEPLDVDVAPDGPQGADGVMVWIGSAGADGERCAASF